MSALELTLLSIAQRHKTLFRRIADAYRVGIPVDQRTGRAFQRLPDVNALILRYSSDEVMVALETVCKTMIEHREEV